MRYKIQLRKIQGWEFFNGTADGSCQPFMDDQNIPAPTLLNDMPESERVMPELFIKALSGCKSLLDIGCGSGYPGFQIAPYVEELVGIDAAPNAIAQARIALSKSSIKNISFEIGGTDGLHYPDSKFDGIMLCGLLESMGWQDVNRIMPEVFRLLQPGGRIAVLDQDWEYMLQTKPARETQIRIENNQLRLVTVERRPRSEVYTWYKVKQESSIGKRMQAELGKRERVQTQITPENLDPEDVIDAWYDETAQFNAKRLFKTMQLHGFKCIQVESITAWGRIIFLTGIKAA